MLSRSVLRAARRPVCLPRRTYASKADKATSSPQGTHGGTTPDQGEPAGKPKYSYGVAAAAVAGGAGWYFLSNKK